MSVGGCPDKEIPQGFDVSKKVTNATLQEAWWKHSIYGIRMYTVYGIPGIRYTCFLAVQHSLENNTMIVDISIFIRVISSHLSLPAQFPRVIWIEENKEATFQA